MLAVEPLPYDSVDGTDDTLETAVSAWDSGGFAAVRAIALPDCADAVPGTLGLLGWSKYPVCSLTCGIGVRPGSVIRLVCNGVGSIRGVPWYDLLSRGALVIGDPGPFHPVIVMASIPLLSDLPSDPLCESSPSSGDLVPDTVGMVGLPPLPPLIDSSNFGRLLSARPPPCFALKSARYCEYSRNCSLFLYSAKE